MGKRILIADAGATNTKWVYVPDLSLINKDMLLASDKWQNEIIFFESEGINPVQQKIEKILEILEKVQTQYNLCDIDEIYFYGAGCISYQSSMMSYHLQAVFGQAKVEVQSDLFGSAKALFGQDEGLTCILGTGSNTGIFKDEKIIAKIPALGYVLGDEGSGCAIGKRLLNAVYKKQLSEDLIQKFHTNYNLSLDDVIMKVYRRPRPAHFLASFSPFILENIDNPQIKEMVKSEFRLFFEHNVIPYKSSLPSDQFECLKIGFTGSIAFYYEKLLKETAADFNLKIYEIIKSPIVALAQKILAHELER